MWGGLGPGQGAATFTRAKADPSRVRTGWKADIPGKALTNRVRIGSSCRLLETRPPRPCQPDINDARREGTGRGAVKRMFWKHCVLGLALSLTAFEAAAQSGPQRVLLNEPVAGYAYYNRSGATVEDHDLEFRDCFVATNVSRDSVPSPGLAFEVIWGGVLRAMSASGVENCMISRGWRVFQLSENEGRSFSRLSDEDFRTRFGPMVGEANPPGVLAREWTNQAARPARYHTASRPRAPSRDQLSARSFALRGYELELRTPEEAAGPRLTDIRGVPLQRASTPEAGKAVVILGATGNRGMGFERTVATGGDYRFGINGSREGAWQTFQVPPGRYRITNTSWLNHCLGSPAFDIEAGEIVYAGTFNLAGEALGPTLNLDDLPGTLTDRLQGARAARYENGSTVPCLFGLFIYPLEIADAP